MSHIDTRPPRARRSVDIDGPPSVDIRGPDHPLREVPEAGREIAPGLPTTSSTIAVSVVISSAAIEAADSSAARVTFSGSITPSSNMSP